MRILLTGADGFIGKHLSEALKSQNHTVFKVDIKNGDITNKNMLDAYKKIDFVYHMAAMTFVPSSWEDTHRYFEVNIIGTVTVLEYCRRTNAGLLFMSTYVYGTPQYLPIDEKHSTTALSPYHESKLIGEDLCKFYTEKFDLNITVFRPFNVFGYGQNEEFVLPKILKQVMDPDIHKVKVFDFLPKRDFIYIDDLIDALLCALKRLPGYNIFNIATGKSTSIIKAIEVIMNATGIKKDYCSIEKARNEEVYDCYANTSLSKELLGFSPKHSFESGIIAWVNEIIAKKGI